MNSKQEILLCKYVDNECGYFERRRAAKLIECSQEAQKYVSSLKKVNENIKSSLTPEKPHSDLWPRISMRIAQEENAAVFLGERRFEEKKSPFTLPSLGFAFGSLATAIFLFSIWIPTSQSGNSIAPQASSQVGTITLASTSSGAPIEPNPGRPQIINEPFQSGIDVDWMRSTGRVRILQNPDERSAIIWVRKKNYQQERSSSSSSAGHSVQLPEDMFQRDKGQE